MSRTPDFLYVGPDKAGSSWLHETLIRHPQIYLTPAKDLYFFDRYYDRGLEWYLDQFRDARGEEVVGEVCQDYLFHPEAADRIRRDLGPVRIMVSLRDPVERAWSSFLYMRKHGERPETFAEALRVRPELIEHGRYATGLARFLRHLPRELVHVALFDDLVADPQGYLDAVTDFLGVDPLPLSEEERAVFPMRAWRTFGHKRGDLLSRLRARRRRQDRDDDPPPRPAAAAYPVRIDVADAIAA